MGFPFPAIMIGDPNVFDVRRFGAVPDGSTDNTGAIQAAIDAMFTRTVATGRRMKVYVPPGDWATDGNYFNGLYGILDLDPAAVLRCVSPRPTISVMEPQDGHTSAYNGYAIGYGGVPAAARPIATGVMDSTYSSGTTTAARWGIRSVADGGGSPSTWRFPVSNLAEMHPSDNRSHWPSNATRFWLAGAFRLPSGGVFDSANNRTLFQVHGQAHPIRCFTESGTLCLSLRSPNWSRFATPTLAACRVNARRSAGVDLSGLVRFIIDYDAAQVDLASAVTIWICNGPDASMPSGPHTYTRIDGGLKTTSNAANWVQGSGLARNYLFDSMTVGGEILGNTLGTSTVSDTECYGLVYGTGARYDRTAATLSLTDEQVFGSAGSGGTVAFRLDGTDFRPSRRNHDRRWAIVIDHNSQESVGFYQQHNQAAASNCLIRGGRVESLVTGIPLFIKTHLTLDVHGVKFGEVASSAYAVYKDDRGTSSYPLRLIRCKFSGRVAGIYLSSCSSNTIEGPTFSRQGRAPFVLKGADATITDAFMATAGNLEAGIKCYAGTAQNSLNVRHFRLNLEGTALTDALFDFEFNTTYDTPVKIEDVYADYPSAVPAIRADANGTTKKASIFVDGLVIDGASHLCQVNGSRIHGYVDGTHKTNPSVSDGAIVDAGYGVARNLTVRRWGASGPVYT